MAEFENKLNYAEVIYLDDSHFLLNLFPLFLISLFRFTGVLLLLTIGRYTFLPYTSTLYRAKDPEDNGSGTGIEVLHRRTNDVVRGIERTRYTRGVFSNAI